MYRVSVWEFIFGTYSFVRLVIDCEYRDCRPRFDESQSDIYCCNDPISSLRDLYGLMVHECRYILCLKVMDFF